MDTFLLAYDSSVIKPISRVDFDILGNDEIREMSALRGTQGVDVPDLYDKQDPKRGGLIDPRMGSSDKHTLCATCKFDTNYCDGHPGHIDLADPVFHIGYLQYVKQFLDCVCLNCSKLLVHKNEEKIKDILNTKSRRNRLAIIHELVKKVKHCQKENYGCGTPVSKIKIDIKKSSNAINIYSETDLEDAKEEGGIFEKKKNRLNLTPDLIFDILDNISDEDLKIMGIDPNRSKPSMMIHKIFPVPPVHVRPSVRGDFTGGSSMEDDLTHKLADIVKANTRIIKQKENSNDNTSKYSKDHAQLLQYHIATYFDDSSITAPKSDQKGKPFKPLAPRFKGKEGRVRGNLMGKRGDFTARTVITSDPTIDNNQLGVPVKIAMNLTFPEVVTPSNIDRLSELVRNGSDNYPGANFVFRGRDIANNKRIMPIYLKFRQEETELQFGDVVERHLQDGDYVLFNRQPTLHKQSMMAHKIKVINNPELLTYRVSVAVTTPYNADFDGDEMNIFVPQSIQTQIELEEIADVKKQIITPTTSTTIIGIVQDGLLGAYNLTHEKMKVDWRNAMNIMSYTSLEDFSKLKKKEGTYKGSELFSMIIPPTTNIKKGDFVVKNGIIQSGRLSKDVLGSKKSNNMIQLIWDEYGEDVTKNFIDDTQRLINNFNMYNGFTVGIGDTVVPDKVHKDIISYISNIENKVELEITKMENNPNITTAELFERSLFSEMNVIRDDVSKIVMQNIDEFNNFGIMINSGSKGGPNNLGQMVGCVGLQSVEGTLIQKKYNNRTLAYFHENDDRAESRGLARQSYMEGLEFPSFVYHMIAGREGIIDQAIKTAETGYAQRKLVKSMEDVMVKYDGTVRIANNQIIQYIYGDTGVDTTKQYQYKINMIEMNNKDLENKFKFTQDELKSYKNFSAKDNDSFFSYIKELRDDIRSNITGAKMNYYTVVDSFKLPVNLSRIIASSVNESDNKNNSKIEPKYILESIEELLSINKTPLVRLSKGDRTKQNNIALKDDRVAKTMLATAIYDALSPKIVNEQYKISKDTFDSIINKIEDNFNNNIIEPGEMIGIIAAQSLGEAVTQMTLNSFHHSGIATKTHTIGGVPRINELISASKNPKAPHTKIYLTNEYRQNREMAHKIASNLEYTTIGHIRSKLDVYYDVNPKRKGGIMERDGVTEPFYSKKLSKMSCQADIENLPWLIRIEIDKEKMLDKEVTLLDIKTKFCNWWEKRHINIKKKKEKMNALKKITSLAVLSNSDNDKQPVIHIRFNVKDLDDVKEDDRKNSRFDRKSISDFIESIVDKTKLKGIDSIDLIDAIVPERYVDIEDGDSMNKGEEYVILASGVNLREIRYIVGIDLNKTISDNIIEMYNTFGIEVARSILINEFTSAYENAGNAVNYQHVALLVDIMTYGGYIMSADRHGMKKADIDPLSKASFEKTVDQLLSAAVFGDSDRMNGISSRIMVGQVIKGGTGYCEIALDTEMIKNSEFVDKSTYTTDVSNAIVGSNIADAIMEGEYGEDIYIP